ncbi:MAG: Xaa-Pro peptidase family protein [Gaiellaceae bacterium]
MVELIDAATRSERLEGLRRRMGESGLDLVALAPSDNLRYVLGFAPHYDERACMLLVTPSSAAVLMPSLNAEQAAGDAPELELVTWSDDAGPADAMRRTLAQVGANGVGRAGIDPEMRADHVLLLQKASPDTSFVSADVAVRPLREVKSDGELRLLQAAADAADVAMRAAFSACRPGATELHVADAAAAAFRAEGCEEVVFTIVGAGANGAFPHYHAGHQPLAVGDAVVIDIGARRDGYMSDITRMVFVGEPTPRYLEVHRTVEAAVQAGLAAARPGATCHEVDAAARAAIEDAGFGECFVHRTGHGLGISTHEPPWIMRGEDVPLKVGMVHSIEPGIYLAGEFGVRLEEIVHVTEQGCERFSSLPRDLHMADAP